MKLVKLAVAVTAVLGSTAALAQQAEGNWMMRVRAVDVQPVKKWDNAGVLPLGSKDVYVESKLIPEVDFTYFFTKNLAAELILTYPQKLNVKILGDKAGTFNALPPTLTLQYHFAPDSNFRPYVGAGINYTAISDVKLGGLKLDSDSWGAAVQVGFDYKIGQNSFINFDIKKVQIASDVKLDSTKLGKVTLDPLLVGVGYGFKF